MLGLVPATIGVDAAGNAYHLTGTGQLTDLGNDHWGYLLRRVSPTGVMEDVAGVVVRACLVFGCRQKHEFAPTALVIDVTGGRIVMTVTASDIDLDMALTTTTMGVVELSGLPTIFDIIPTFQPTSETLGWLTPKHPEALPAADRFMVYAGDIAALRQDRDFTRATPVDCQVPDMGVPSPGEFLSILDPLQVEPGQASYAVVGVEHQGRLRFGRQSMGGVLMGREPNLFPICG